MKPYIARIVALSGINGLVAVTFSGFVSHILDTSLSPQILRWLDTAVLMQINTSACLLGAAFLARFGKRHWAERSALASLLGVLLFCGSLYALTLGGPGTLGPFALLTPLGGIALMAGWAFLVIGALRSSKGISTPLEFEQQDHS